MEMGMEMENGKCKSLTVQTWAALLEKFVSKEIPN